jgi:hypothetical protein
LCSRRVGVPFVVLVWAVGRGCMHVPWRHGDGLSDDEDI